MITLWGSLFGFLGGLIPGILKFFKEKEDRAHELKVLDRQIDAMKVHQSHQLEEIKSVTEAMELRQLYAYLPMTGSPWVDALSGTVRPLLTYGFFFLYLMMKVMQVISCVAQQTCFSLWSEEDQALFAAVMAFWFGQRAMIKMRK